MKEWFLSDVFTEGDRYVVTAEAKGVAQREVHVACIGLVEGVIQRLDVGVVVEVVGGGWS